MKELIVMHMADALITPAVGGTMWVATGAVTALSARRVRERLDQSRVPLMGVLGAFVFAAQMVNFTIPATGSSGHIGGGLILAILLGPEAAFLVMASVVTVQALFFADGGLLALGCNVFNLGVLPAFVAYPVYRRIAGDPPSPGGLAAGSIAGGLVAVGLGAVAVVLQTTLSGVSELPFGAFASLMVPIHLAIGMAEGLATAAVIGFVLRVQPELLADAGEPSRAGRMRVLVALGVAALLAGGVLARFGSAAPDGLEWSVAGASRGAEVEGARDPVSEAAGELQRKTAVLPDYALRPSEEASGSAGMRAGTGVAALAGIAATLLLAAGVGVVLRRRSTRLFRRGAARRATP